MNKQIHLESTTGRTADMVLQENLKYDCILSLMIKKKSKSTILLVNYSI